MAEKNRLLQIIRIASEYGGDASLPLENIMPYLNGTMSLRMLEKGKEIVKQDVVISKVYFVLYGSFYETRFSESGKTNMLIKRKAPQFIGVDRAVTPAKTKMSDIVAAEPCAVLEIDTKYFLYSLKTCGDLGIEVLKNVLEKITADRASYDNIRFLNSKERVMMYLLGHCEPFETGEKRCIVHESNAQIADSIGASLRTVQRILKKMKDAGEIEIVLGKVQMTEGQTDRLKSSLNLFEE